MVKKPILDEAEIKQKLSENREVLVLIGSF